MRQYTITTRWNDGTLVTQMQVSEEGVRNYLAPALLERLAEEHNNNSLELVIRGPVGTITITGGLD